MHPKVTLVTPTDESPREIIARLEQALSERGEQKPEIMVEVSRLTGDLLCLVRFLEADGS